MVCVCDARACFLCSTKEEAAAAFAKRSELGLTIPSGYTYMPTKTMSGGKHWLKSNWGDYGWHAHQCCNKENQRYTRCCYTPGKQKIISCLSGTALIPGVNKCIDKAGKIGLSGSCSSSNTCTARQKECQNNGGDWWCVKTAFDSSAANHLHKPHANTTTQLA